MWTTLLRAARAARGERLAPTPSRACLLLSQPYAPLADEVERLGWPTIRESANHLVMLTRPELLADRLLQLLDALP